VANTNAATKGSQVLNPKDQDPGDQNLTSFFRCAIVVDKTPTSAATTNAATKGSQVLNPQRSRSPGIKT